VLAQARDEGVGRPIADDEIPRRVKEAMWDPAYVPLVAARAVAEPECAEAVPV
jgi:hypothetical protein